MIGRLVQVVTDTFRPACPICHNRILSGWPAAIVTDLTSDVDHLTHLACLTHSMTMAWCTACWQPAIRHIRNGPLACPGVCHENTSTSGTA